MLKLIFTCFAIAENFITWYVSSNNEAHWLTFTIIEAFPFPRKKLWNSRVNLLSRKGTIVGWLLKNNACKIIRNNTGGYIYIQAASQLSCTTLLTMKHLRMKLVITQGADTFSKCHNRGVDITGFLELLSISLGFTISLWTGKIHNWESALNRFKIME